MFPRFHCRAGHYALLLAVAAGLFLVNLGGPSLWDIDEGNNAEAAREMMARGDWVVPYFNGQLRVDKPALLYWLQIGAYRLFGINEFAARLPSALAAIVTVLVTYELGRLLFGAAAGLLAGLVLASAALFCAAGHFANPDALLNALTTLTFLAFWYGFSRESRAWLIPAGVTSGLAFLAKGPVGLVLPLAVAGLFLLWSGRLRLLLNRRLVGGVLAFVVVALPWYAWVGAETKGEFLRGFFLTHNLGRFGKPMENHSGPVFYYAVVLLAGFAPWSAFLGPAGWYAVKGMRNRPTPEASQPAGVDPRAAYRFLGCWAGVYFLFFSLSGTKLPNYILPLYPPVALLTASFLDGWRRGALQPPAWVIRVSLVCLALMGAGVALGLGVAGGVVRWPALRGHVLPGLEAGALLGAVPILAAAAAWWFLEQRRRGPVVAVVAAAAVLFVGSLAAWGGSVLNAHKAPRPLAEVIRAHQAEPDIRVGCYRYFQPSLVFYSGREVFHFEQEADALEFLECPLPAYLVLPADAWDALRHKVSGPPHVLARHRDMYRNCEVVVVANR